MSDIQPFPGLRPRPDLVHLVASPPYDVLNSEEAREMAKGNPHSFLHVTKAEIDLPPDADPHKEEVYQKGAENFKKMIEEGVLIRDEKPCFYIYQLTMGDHSQRGLVVGASVDEYVRGVIKKHELTRREKEDDRARHVEVLGANAGPVLFTYRAQEGILNLINHLCARDEPVYHFKAVDGVGHTLWRVDQDGEIHQIQQAFLGVEALYVADGHHRTASAYRVRDILKAKNPGHMGKEPYNHFMAVLFPDEELRIMGYHRVIKDLHGHSVEAFIEKVQEKFTLAPTDQPEPSEARQFTMYLEGKWYRLEAKEGTFSSDDPVKSLDVSILQDNLLGPLLAIDDPRTSSRIDFVGGIRGTKELERRCSKDMKVAFALYPVSVDQLMTIADRGAIMPPKSTWFEPKLRSGMVIRTL